MYLFEKPWKVVIEFWNEKSSALEGAMSILLKVLLFQLSGRGNPHDDAMPNFISILILVAVYQGFQMSYHLFQNSFWEVVKTSDWKPGVWNVILQTTKTK